MLKSLDQNDYIHDILLQPDCLRRLQGRDVADALESMGKSIEGYSRVILTGMGSSYSALRPLWLSLVKNGISAWLVDAAECLSHFPPLIDRTTLVIAASQSGRSAEIVALCEEVRSRHGRLLAITNDLTSPLAINAHAVIDIHVGVENTVSTKTYLNTLGVGVVIDRVLFGSASSLNWNATADLLSQYLADWRTHVDGLKETLGLPDRLYFLARGPSLAAAQYGALIMKEASRWPVEAQNVPQFRHGPLELADARLTVVILAGRDEVSRQQNRSLHKDLLGYGARSFWLDSEPGGGPLSIPASDVDTTCIMEAVPLQLLSVAVAEQAGIQPGSFRHLKKITTVL